MPAQLFKPQCVLLNLISRLWVPGDVGKSQRSGIGVPDQRIIVHSWGCCSWGSYSCPLLLENFQSVKGNSQDFCLGMSREDGYSAMSRFLFPSNEQQDVDTFRGQIYVQDKSIPQQFISWLSKTVKQNTQDLEQGYLAQTVKKMINQLIDLVVRKDTRFEVSEIIETGSSYDGTKINAPDEFDYLVVIKKFSSDNCEYVLRKCQDNRGFAHVYLKDSPRKSWDDLLSPAGQLECISFRNQFRYICHEIIYEDMPGCTISTSEGILALKDYAVSVSGPQCNVRFVWSNTGGSSVNISVDICPTIKFDSVSRILGVDDAANARVYDAMKDSGHVLLIPRPQASCNYCLKLVFAEADRKIVKSMDECHKQCLLIMKYIGLQVTTGDSRLKKVFNPFALKMAVLHHMFQCRRQGACEKCILEILGDLQMALKRFPPTMPSVFVMEHNVWRTLLGNKTIAEQQRIAICLEVLGDLIQFFQSPPEVGGDGDLFKQLQERLDSLCKREGKRRPKKQPSVELPSPF